MATEDIGEEPAVPRSHTVAVLQKALDVIEHLAYRPAATMRAISEATGVEKAAVYRILNTLEQRGFTERDDEKRYAPGPQLLAAASALLSEHDIVADMLPTMHALRDEFQETVNLGVLIGADIEYLAIVESQLSLRMTAEVGAVHQARSTALGKAILASLPAEELRDALGVDGDVPRDLRDELARTRERGYAIDFEENERGAICVAALVPSSGPGRPHAISISGPITRMSPVAIERIGTRLRDALGA